MKFFLPFVLLLGACNATAAIRSYSDKICNRYIKNQKAEDYILSLIEKSKKDISTLETAALIIPAAPKRETRWQRFIAWFNGDEYQTERAENQIAVGNARKTKTK